MKKEIGEYADLLTDGTGTGISSAIKSAVRSMYEFERKVTYGVKSKMYCSRCGTGWVGKFGELCPNCGGRGKERK